MANEHSIRVSARGEFGQLERGLKNLQKDLNSVLGEIDKGARRGGIFDETQLRALDLYRGRFKGTMNELNREFEKQNSLVEELNRKKEKASQSEQNNIEKEIRGREKALDVLRRQIMAMEDLYRKRGKEAQTYGSAPTKETGGAPSSGGGGGGTGSGGGILGAGLSKALGAGKFVAGLAGIAGIASMAQEAYKLAYASQVQPMNLSQRIRGQGYSGSAKGMWDEIGGIGRNDSMGYTSAESWGFQDQYSRQAGALNPQDLENSLKFGRGYGLEANETAGALGSMRQLGGTTSASQFADMIASSVGKSGMTPRILEVMQTSAGLLANMNTTLKDTGAKQILAYQTTLDTIGTEKGMMKLTGAQGANIIQGLGGIYSPGQGNDWKYMGMQALQQYDPKKYGKMGLYDLETSFEDGLMNEDNLPAMSKFIKGKSGGNQDLEKRMLQKWLQDGGYNATKTQTNDLYKATDGLSAFSEDKMKAVMGDLQNGDGTKKYQERVGQPGQDILDVNSRFEKQLENLGQPLLAVVTELKGGVTGILEELTGNKTVDNILKFMEDHLVDLATLAGLTALAPAIAKLIKVGGGGGGGNGNNKDGGKEPDKKSTPSIPPIIAGGKNVLPKLVKGGGILAGVLSLFDTFGTGDEEKHKTLMKKNGYTDKQIKEDSGFLDRWATNFISRSTFGLVSPEKQYKAFSPKGMTNVKESVEGFFKTLFPSMNVPQSKEVKDNANKAHDYLNDPNRKLEGIEHFYPDNWGKDKLGDKSIWQGHISFPESWGKNFEDMKNGFFNDFIKPMNEITGWDIGGEKKQQAIDSLVNLGNTGTVNISGMTELGKAKMQELADQGLIKIEKGKTAQTTLLSGFTEEGKTKLSKLADEGLISIGGFTADGKAKITVLSDKGKDELEKLKKNGSVDIGKFTKEGTLKITSLSEDGAKELINLQKNGSLSMDSMDTTTTKKLEDVRKKTHTKLDDIAGEHKSWSEKLVGKDGIFTKWADGAKGIFQDILDWFKSLNPFGGGDSSLGIVNGGGGKKVDSHTLAYKDELAKAGEKYGITDTNLLMAIMNQETHGRGFNPMQLEGATGPEDSIDGGVKYFADMLKKAGGDTELALQGYNMGPGYIDYVNKNGGKTTPALAKKFSQKQLASHPNWNQYGDANYVDNVLQYYPKTKTKDTGDFFNGWENRVTTEFGAVDSMHSTPHGGLDINGEQGDALQALAGGKVKFLYMDDGSSKDADRKKNTRKGGTELGIQMANGETYFYSHLSKVEKGLKVGDTVEAGQYLANVGGDPGVPGSGEHTSGSHLHLGYLNKNGIRQDPRKLMNALNAGDSDIGVSSASVQKKDITITLKLDGKGANQLNSMTESHLRAMVTNAIKEYERMKTLLNPSVGGF